MSLFEFARASQLRKVFEPSSLGGSLVLNELESTVQLVHPAIGAGESGAEFRNFVFTGAAAQNPVDLSPTPADLIQYYQFLQADHTDAVTAQSMAYVLIDNRNGAQVVLMDTRQMTNRFPTGVVASGVAAYFDRGLIVVPPFCFIRTVCFTVLGAGAVINVRGNVRVGLLAETPPPMF